MKRSGWDGATIERCTFSSGIKDSAADDDRGATAPPTPSSKARAFERHRHANVRAFVLGRGWRDDGADCVVVGNSGTRGDVHRGHRGADKAESDADDTIFETKYLVKLNNYLSNINIIIITTERRLR